MNIHYEQVARLSPEDYVVIKEIYETNFPSEERIPFDKMLEYVADGSLLYVARVNHRPIGFIWISPMGHSPHYFMNYFAVEKALQGQKIGENLLREVIHRLRNKKDAETLIWEVEPPHPDENHVQNRRIRFYERNGAFLVTYSTAFAMPNMNDPHNHSVPMRIMVAPLTPFVPANNKANAIIWIETIYTHIYTNYPKLRQQILSQLNQLKE